MDSLQIELLSRQISRKRAGRGVRQVAAEIGISPATLSRVENGKIPDLETFGKICRWLGEDPAQYLGMATRGAPPTARVHFKKGATMRQDSAKALGEMILAAMRKLEQEEG